jgi:hypothetical protein
VANLQNLCFHIFAPIFRLSLFVRDRMLNGKNSGLANLELKRNRIKPPSAPRFRRCEKRAKRDDGRARLQHCGVGQLFQWEAAKMP